MGARDSSVAVYLEVGRRRSFALARGWPGWCRGARTPAEALAALERYRPRYVAAVPDARDVGPLEVVGEVVGDATTDFGAPNVLGPGDDRPLAAPELARQLEVLRACWDAFDVVVARAPERLTRGPRGGGRDRDAVVAHVREAERAYGRRIGTRVPPRTPWPDQRAALSGALLAGATAPWPAAYALRRVAWHVLDHAWEIEDRSPPDGSVAVVEVG